MLPPKLIEAVQRRAVLRRLMQDTRVFYGPIDGGLPQKVIECGSIVPVDHNAVPVTVIHVVVEMLQQLEQFENENIEKFTVVEREKNKIPRVVPKESKDAAVSDHPAEGTERAPARKKPLRRGKTG